MKNNELEKYSSAYTMSDMEIFVFPELFYPLVLANILSPEIWEWKKDPWFHNIEKKTFNKKVNRIKQFIMDHFVFNLDLETWGLTTKEKEMERFKDFVDMDLLKQSNALFGYEGDKYYFSNDIRKHFGLDQYNSNVIPYWKTETLEAMKAFRYKEGYQTGAGECVSLSTLYAAALFVIGNIPLEKIYLMATPLHSQNFIDHKEGVITNNRRILTKSMWYNGTILSNKARRALENEKITIVSHITGYIHTLYKEAVINKDHYHKFKKNISSFLHGKLTPVTLGNFLRMKRKFWCCFQYRFIRNKRPYYIPLEKVFQYEHHTNSNFTANSRNALLNEIDAEEFSISPFDNRMILNDFEKHLNESKKSDLTEMEEQMIAMNNGKKCKEITNFFKGIREFLIVEPRFPVEKDKTFGNSPALHIETEQGRDQIFDLIMKAAPNNEMALLTLHAYRQMDKVDWRPFLKAAIERNPVLLEYLCGVKIEKAYHELCKFDDHSIYPGNRLAQPDEVCNFKKGDGIEKAIALAAYATNLDKECVIKIEIMNEKITMNIDNCEFIFVSKKSLVKTIHILRDKIDIA